MSKISLCMIVKNEEKNLSQCLDGVAQWVDEIILVDTGSIDNTVEVAKSYGCKVYHYLWHDNFSAARNFSLEQATGDWILVLDGDEQLSVGSESILREKAKAVNIEGYYIKVENCIEYNKEIQILPDLIFRFFRNKPEYRFKGVIREEIVPTIKKANPDAKLSVIKESLITHYGYLKEMTIQPNNKNEQILYQLTTIFPQEPLWRLHYGIELYRNQYFKRAARELNEAIAQPLTEKAYLHQGYRYLISALIKSEQYLEAIEYTKDAILKFPLCKDMCYYQGLSYFLSKEYTRAYETIISIVDREEEPEDIEDGSLPWIRKFNLYYLLGIAREKNMMFDEAIHWYLAAVNGNREYKPALEGLVRLLNVQGDTQAIRDVISRVGSENNPRFCYNIGEICFREGIYDIALEYLEKSYPRGNYSPEIKILMAVCQTQLGRFFRGLKILKEYPKESYLYPIAILTMLFSHWAQGNKGRVRSLLQELKGIGLNDDVIKVLYLFKESIGDGKTKYQFMIDESGRTLLYEFIKRGIYLGKIEQIQLALKMLDQKTIKEIGMELGDIFIKYHQYQEANKYLLIYVKEHRQDKDGNIMLAYTYEKLGQLNLAKKYYHHATRESSWESHVLKNSQS